MLALAVEMHREGSARDYPLNLERTAYILSRLVGTSTALVCGAFDGQVCQGVLVAEVASHLFVDMLVAQEHALYVRPEARGGRSFLMLMRHFEHWAAEQGVDVIHISDELRGSEGRLGRLLLRMGYAPHGGSYQKRMPTCPS